MFLTKKSRFVLLCVVWLSTTILLSNVLQRTAKLHIEIGSSQDQPFTHSFFQAETAPDGSIFRWSNADAGLLLPGANGGRYLVDLRINGDLRREIKAPELELRQSSGDPLKIELEPGWRVYHVLLPEPMGNGFGLAQLELSSQAYEHEKRTLGVPIDWVSFRELSLGKAGGANLLQSGLFSLLLAGLLVALMSLGQLVGLRWRGAAFWLALAIFVLVASTLLYALWQDRYALASWLRPSVLLAWGALGLLTPLIKKLLAWVFSESGQALEGYEGGADWKPSRFWLLTYALGAAIFSSLYFAMTVEFEDATLARLADFSAFRPYQYRVLLPSIVRGIAWIIPLPIEWIYMGLTWAATLGLLLAFRALCSYWLSNLSLELASLVLLYAMSWNYAFLSIFIYPSDIVAILLFVLGILCLIQGRMRLYYALFILGCLNRETICFLTVAMLFLYLGRRPLGWLVWHSCAQALIWFVLKAALAYLFRENYGESVFQNQIGNNLLFIGDLFALDSFALWSLASFGGLWLLLPFVWKGLPEDLQRLLLVTVPFVLGMSVVGLLYEVRIYSEVLPLMCAAWSIALARQLQPRYKLKPFSSP